MSMAAIGAAVVVGGATYMATRSQKAPSYAGDVNVGATAAESIRTNIANAPEAEMLTRRTNAFNQRENMRLLEQAMPGYGKWAETMSSNAIAQSQGKISAEQSAALTRFAAERGIKTGVRGVANDYSLLRDFGVNQMQAQQQSMGIVGSLMSMAKVNPMSSSSMYVAPAQALAVASENRSAQQGFMNSMNAYENQQRAAGWNALAAGAGAYMGMSGGAPKAASATGSYTGPMSATPTTSYQAPGQGLTNYVNTYK